MESKSAVCANPDIQSLQDILLFGLKGVAAYADHAQILGKTDDSIYAFMDRGSGGLTGPISI